MTQALQKVQPNSLAKVDFKELNDLARMAVESGMFPDLKSVAQAGMKILAGKELGFDPIVSITGIHFFQGKVVVGANLLASLIKDSGKYEYKVLELTNQKCSIQFMRKFDGKWQPMGVPVVYTTQDAHTAALDGKEVWKKFPADMLFASCIRKGAKRYCADILRGMSGTGDETEFVEGDVGAAAQETESIDGEIVGDEDEFTPADDSPESLENLRQAVADAGRKLPLKDYQKILDGRDVDKMNGDELRVLLGELPAF